jgi:hypothetical protein
MEATHTIAQGAREDWQGDILDFYDESLEEGLNPKLVETTVVALAKEEIGTICGSYPNEAFKHIAFEYPNLKVRTCIAQDPYELRRWQCCSCEIYVHNREEADKIEELAERGSGSLREEFYEPGWNYFENE